MRNRAQKTLRLPALLQKTCWNTRWKTPLHRKRQTSARLQSGRTTQAQRTPATCCFQQPTTQRTHTQTVTGKLRERVEERKLVLLQALHCFALLLVTSLAAWFMKLARLRPTAHKLGLRPQPQIVNCSHTWATRECLGHAWEPCEAARQTLHNQSTSNKLSCRACQARQALWPQWLEFAFALRRAFFSATAPCRPSLQLPLLFRSVSNRASTQRSRTFMHVAGLHQRVNFLGRRSRLFRTRHTQSLTRLDSSAFSCGGAMFSVKSALPTTSPIRADLIPEQVACSPVERA